MNILCKTVVMVDALDDAEQNINQEISSILRRLESHAGRSEQLSEIYNAVLNAQSELDDATAKLAPVH